MKNGSIISDEIKVADAHPSGKRPFKREQYIKKFRTLTEGIISKNECNRFLKVVQNLKKLKPNQLSDLNIKISAKLKSKSSKKCIF